ncbi:protocatechuate 3,4-dioxygenase beta subunit [Promicromonospora sp. AC04]|uniref:intradiol ring-cleavage dioxygenase n=1 Tax=Promicromonospora sp. AC04 TaxID=2135723 RepID=UPI000D387EEF|nr:intradiol ring-cleavage dioxygenase [Promicromonospora sp. AC04]PUB31546.1 protocatechuate 3,4-dioxygenase beta subunit [Promicromonospora sp. AC04]
MARIPEPPVPSQSGLSYQGRPLPRPDDEVVDQGLSFDVGTLVSRRRVLSLLGVGIGAVGLAACGASDPTGTSSSAATTSDGEIPDETAGPYPGDGSNGPDVLEETGIVRSDIRSSIGGGATAAGVPMTLTLTLLDMANDDAPFQDVAVYVWHCDAAGGYSMYSEGLEDETYLRGVQVTDSDGVATWTSIFPACYTGRWPHIHFEVYPDVGSIDDSTNAIATSQVALPEDVARTVYALDEYAGSTENLDQVTLDTDNVFSDDGGELQLATVSGDADSGYTVALTVRVDTATEPTGGAAPGGGGGAGGGGGEPPSGGPSGEPPSGAPPEG